MSRSHFTSSEDIIRDLWTTLSLPPSALSDKTLEITGPERTIPSSYKLSLIPPAAIATSTLAAALIYTHRTHSENESEIKKVKVNTLHATLEYSSEINIQILGTPTPEAWGPISGTYETADDGIIGIHANFINHAVAALEVLGLPIDCVDKPTVAGAVRKFKALELERIAHERKAVIYALRSPLQWNAEEQSRYTPSFPIIIRKIGEAPAGLPKSLRNNSGNSCLSGLRVAEITRVLAGPVCGRTLASHGADVLWIHGPHLPSLPAIDIDTSRGKRSTFLDLRTPEGVNKLKDLLSTADVFIQSFRPGAISTKGFSPSEVASLNPDGIIYASLNAFGEDGPWNGRRGFDSMVQLCSGINISEAESFKSTGKQERFKKWPCQALDHTAGYFLAIGILTALHRRITEGGSWEVHVSLAGVMEYITSLGRIDGKEAFEVPKLSEEDVGEFMEVKEGKLGSVKGVKHAGRIEGVEVGYRYMPTELGHYEATWEG
ncbi:hypothetical protein TWF481_003923 [Arthrobotrys musiformis]|uniref:CoA-transferase family III n=1 Tax=Arthrobotrys musiformis TaxID=47236 RepID=A0AAV9WK22_9PEZI